MMMSSASKHWLLGVVAGVAMGSAVPASAANLLSNAGFEPPDLSDWSFFSNAFAVGSGAFNPALNAPRTGSGAVLLLGGFGGNPDFSGFFQDVAVSAGTQYEASIYGLIESANNENPPRADNINGRSNVVKLLLEWKDSGGAQISNDEVTVMDGNTGTIPTDQWLKYSLAGTAPTGAVTGRIVVLFIQSNFAGGVTFWDDASLQVVPEPTAALLAAFAAPALLARRRRA